jgi:hypothetical protein
MRSTSSFTRASKSRRPENSSTLALTGKWALSQPTRLSTLAVPAPPFSSKPADSRREATSSSIISKMMSFGRSLCRAPLRMP